VAIKVLIADDHAIVRAGLRAVINAETELVLIGEATGGVDAIEQVKSLAPDILVLDISMPDLDGIEVIKSLRKDEVNCKILILTVHEDEALLREVLKLGASGYIIKHAAETELISAINAVIRGDLYIHPKMIRALIEPEKRHSKKLNGNHEPLTAREEDVLRLIVQGYTNKQVAEELNISTRTVEGHRANLTEKLGIRNRVDLLRYAKSNKII
jgi:DNA-binding NarL/FixJ family response regulator